MRPSAARFGLHLLKGFCACASITVLGCGGLKLVPVSGKARLDGHLLTRGVVSFNPDTTKGNNIRVACTGRIKGDGQYEIFTDDGSNVRKGAPLGWYKVTILAVTPGEDKLLPVNKRYTDPDTTDLSVEVVTNPEPGAYDLEFKK
jgi:hypothetical protein